MKKICALVLTTAMLLSFASCGKKDTTKDIKTTEANQTQTSESTTAVSQENNETQGTTENSGESIQLGEITPGCMYILKGGPVISSIALTGNRAGSSDFNNTKTAAAGIRDIFELNEYVEMYLTTKATDGIQVFVFKHNEVAEVYNNYNYSGELQNLVARADLTKPENDGDSWGSLYVNPEDADPGYYDIVFVCDGAPVVVIKVRMYAEEELAGKTDNELHSLMDSIKYE